MGSIFKTAFPFLASIWLLTALLPQAVYAGMAAGGCTMTHSHACNGYGGLTNHPEFNDHCDHSEGNTSGEYPGAQNCCADPGWLAANPPAPTPASEGNRVKTNAKPVSTKPRSINVSTD